MYVIIEVLNLRLSLLRLTIVTDIEQDKDFRFSSYPRRRSTIE